MTDYTRYHSLNFTNRKRTKTLGIVLHSTRGGAATVGEEFQGTINWFMNPRAEASSHLLIAYDGTAVQFVDWDLWAWHAQEMNIYWLGVELVQPHHGDAISEAQYQALAVFCKEMAARYNFELIPGQTLVEHKDTIQGKRNGKSDIDAPFSITHLMEIINGGDNVDKGKVINALNVIWGWAQAVGPLNPEAQKELQDSVNAIKEEVGV